MELTKVHRVACFEQKAWLKAYISRNTKKRTARDNKSLQEIYIFSLIVFYGKTMEKICNRMYLTWILTDDTEEKYKQQYKPMSTRLKSYDKFD